MEKKLYNIYLKTFGDTPKWLRKYLTVPSIERLKYISYFCGMDFASKDIYNFREPISRYDHSLTTALVVWQQTHDKKATLGALFHDVGTPCFSHVIDYMYGDYIKQESTEKYTETIIRNDKELLKYLEEDGFTVDDLDFKKYSIVDNERPKLCADRFDGIILTGIAWTKSITENDIYLLTSNLCIDKKEKELAFIGESATKRAIELNKEIDEYCHTKEDNYMMDLLARIVRTAINLEIITELDLYTEEENTIYIRIRNSTCSELKNLVYEFENKRKEEIPDKKINSKVRTLAILCNGKRIK